MPRATIFAILFQVKGITGSWQPKCENTVKALEKMGVLSDTWHLYNYDELDEIQKKTGVTE